LTCPRSRFHPSVPVHAGHQTAATCTIRCSPPARKLSWFSWFSWKALPPQRAAMTSLLLTALPHGRHRWPFRIAMQPQNLKSNQDADEGLQTLLCEPRRALQPGYPTRCVLPLYLNP
jgi:hypothetical protein